MSAYLIEAEQLNALRSVQKRLHSAHLDVSDHQEMAGIIRIALRSVTAADQPVARSTVIAVDDPEAAAAYVAGLFAAEKAPE